MGKGGMRPVANIISVIRKQNSPAVTAFEKNFGHRAYLDSLRALAALWVVLSHLWIGEFGMNAHWGMLGLATNWTLYSHLAVDVFIVLSGFCLMLPVVRDGGCLRNGARAFLKRRAWRILPPFYAALAISVLLVLALQKMDHQAFHLPPTALLANVFLMQDIFLPLNVFNGPFWSIAVEWRIYFLFPAMVWSAKHWGWGRTLGGAALIGLALTLAMFRWHPEMILASPWFLLLFALGAWAGAASEKTTSDLFWTMLAGAAGVSLAALLWTFPITAQGGADFGRHMPVVDIAAGTLAAAMLVIVGRRPAAFPLLSWQPLAQLGTFAYSLYLIHMPTLTLIRHLLLLWLPPETPALMKVGLTALVLPLVLGLAYLFFLAFERPFLRRNHAIFPLGFNAFCKSGIGGGGVRGGCKRRTADVAGQ